MRDLALPALLGALLIVCALPVEAGADASAPQAPPAHATIKPDPERIGSHVKVLTGDSPAKSGAASGERAADYIARQLASYGLRPAGENGSYFQAVPLIEVTTLDETSFSLVNDRLETLSLRNLEDVAASNESLTESAYIDAGVVFVGYGISAAEFGRDDYKDTRLEGKVALVLADEPPSSDSATLQQERWAYYGGSAYKFAETAGRGALATLIIHRPDSPGPSWEAVRQTWGRTRSYPAGERAPKLRAASWLRLDAAQKLAALGGADLQTLIEHARSKDFKPVELQLRLQAHVVSSVRTRSARNVLAMLPGRGAASAQAVLYTAPCDGANPGAAPTAMAGATACSMLLETARVWSRAPSPPPRMMVFAALAAESEGLIGSRYLAQHSPVLPARISLNLSYEPLPAGSGEALMTGGAERTTFYATLEERASALGLAIRPDPPVASRSYYESTPFSFAQTGIPAFSIATVISEGREAAAAGAHRDRIDLSGAARLVRLGYELGVQASSQPGLVAWREGEEFEAERKRSEVAGQIRPRTSRPRVKHP